MLGKKDKKIGIVVGSLRKDSFSRKIARDIKELIPEEYEVVIPEIGQLALYDEDLDNGNPPVEWQDFRDEVGSWDAILFVTPEYNRSMPAVIKNALDVASRPYGENKWGNKPAGVVSSSTGGMGGFGANHHLRQSATFLDMYMLQQPERYLANIESSYDGDKINERLKSFLQSFIDSYIEWIEIFIS